LASENRLAFLVYNPPADGFPYLAVMLGFDGNVSAVPYDTLEEAEHHNQVRATEAADLADEQRQRNSLDQK